MLGVRSGKLDSAMANYVEVNSHITGYHVYKDIWVQVLGETLPAAMEPTNYDDDHAVCVKKDSAIYLFHVFRQTLRFNVTIVGHLERGESGRFAQTIFFFLRADSTASCNATVTGQPVNLGDLLGKKVPCKLRLSGRKDYVNVLDATLKNL